MPAEEDMSKRIHIFILVVLSIFIVSGCTKKQSVNTNSSNEVTVFTYDSFCGEWGPGSELAKLAKEKTGLTVKFVDCGDGVQLLSSLILDKEKKVCDVAIGLDNNLVQKALNEGLFQKYKPHDASKVIPSNLIKALDSDWRLTPFDYSHFAFIYDTESKIKEPTCLEDLKDPIYEKRIILMDPRTSTPGLGFFNWTVAVYGDKTEDYWKAIKPNILTMAPGWSAGYGLFTSGEAPLVISYTTSPASHVEYENSFRYKALEFTDGHPMQVEGAGISANTHNLENAQKFMDFLITEDAQFILTLTQWMYPANKNTKLPECYKKAAIIPQKTLFTNAEAAEKKLDSVMNLLK